MNSHMAQRSPDPCRSHFEMPGGIQGVWDGLPALGLSQQQFEGVGEIEVLAFFLRKEIDLTDRPYPSLVMFFSR